MMNKTVFPEVKKIIAVASGKGGVGKSTVSANLAYALSLQGHKTAIYDADIYGPSIPIIYGLEDYRPELIPWEDYEKIIPAVKDGIQIMSIGFFLDPDQPAIWRGPAASSYLKQFLENTLWKEIDYLIIDLPPGTGDIVLTLCQDIPLDGAIIVTTPQKLSLADVNKSIMMFNHHDIAVPILGVVENMSWFTPKQHVDEKYLLFGEGGGKFLAEKFGTELLAQIPLIEGMCDATDKGNLHAFADNEIIRKSFEKIANIITIEENYIKEEKKMKICIPINEQKGLDSLAYGHFGSAPYFLIYDTETKGFEILNNNEAEHEHGQCNPIQPLREKNVTAVVVAGMGSRALTNLQSLGIRVYKISENETVKDIIAGFDSNKMQELTAENSCQHHNCH